MTAPTLTQLGRYRIVAELGRGAMGVVYRAEDVPLNRTVAIKTIIMSSDAAERAEYEARFNQEARAAGGLNHPNLITIHDVGREGDIAYMAMELLEGVELRELMRRGRLPLPLALDVVAQAAEGLAYAHERGVVHRDIKPGNIMVVRGRHAKIMDFGIARVRASDIKTQTGAILGSPKYMSPEQVAGQPVDHRSDIFSLGVVLYEASAGAPPFSGPEVSRIMYQIANAAHSPPSALNPALPAMLDLIVARALEKTTDARYQSAGELAADLRACLAGMGAGQSAQPAPDEATVRLDAGIASTAKLDVEIASTQAAGHAATAIVRSGGAGSTTDSGTFLPVSRRFDSAAAMQRLAQQAAAGANAALAPSPGTQAVLLRVWRDPGWLTVAAAVALAVLVAVAIALA